MDFAESGIRLHNFTETHVQEMDTIHLPLANTQPKSTQPSFIPLSDYEVHRDGLSMPMAVQCSRPQFNNLRMHAVIWRQNELSMPICLMTQWPPR